MVQVGVRFTWLRIQLDEAARGVGHSTEPSVIIMMICMANLTLVYGLRLLPEGEVTEIKDATLKLGNGHEAHVTMHVIDGSREEIEAQLKRSLDAFFDFYPEI
jgi:hypothetical protein